MLLVASTFIGSAWVLSEKGHVNMEYLYTFMSEKNVTKLKVFTGEEHTHEAQSPAKYEF